MTESVASLVERLTNAAEYQASLCSPEGNATADLLRAAASRLAEGMRAPKVPCDNCIVLQHCEHHKRCLAECTPRDLFTTSPAPVHICGDPNDACDHECADKFYEAQERRKSSPSSAPAATPAIDGIARYRVHLQEEIDRLLNINLTPAGKDNLRDARRQLETFDRMMEASPRVSAATPAPYGSEVLCESCAHVFCPHGEQLHFHHDGCPACADDSASAASQPAQTCATCKHYKQDAHRMSGPCELGVKFDLGGCVPYNFGCTLHEPLPPGPVAQ